MTDFLNQIFNGANAIPTALLLFILLYTHFKDPWNAADAVYSTGRTRGENLSSGAAPT